MHWNDCKEAPAWVNRILQKLSGNPDRSLYYYPVQLKAAGIAILLVILLTISCYWLGRVSVRRDYANQSKRLQDVTVQLDEAVRNQQQLTKRITESEKRVDAIRGKVSESASGIDRGQEEIARSREAIDRAKESADGIGSNLEESRRLIEESQRILASYQ